MASGGHLELFLGGGGAHEEGAEISPGGPRPPAPLEIAPGGRGVFVACCTNALRGMSAIADFVVHYVVGHHKYFSQY